MRIKTFRDSKNDMHNKEPQEAYEKVEQDVIDYVLEYFENNLQRRVWKIYHFGYNDTLVIFTRPINSSFNFRPYYEMQLKTKQITQKDIPEDMLIEPVIYNKEERDCYYWLPYSMVTTEFEDKILEICDVVYYVNDVGPFTGIDMSEIGTDWIIEFKKGCISDNDEVEIINCNGTLGGKINIAHIERFDSGNKLVLSEAFSLQANQEDSRPLYLVKVSGENKEKLKGISEKIKKEIDEL